MNEVVNIRIIDRIKENLPILILGLIVTLLGLFGYLASSQGYLIIFPIIGIFILISGIYRAITPEENKQTIPAPNTV